MREECLCRDGGHRHGIHRAASAVQSSTVHSFFQQMHALFTLAKCCFQGLATKAGMGRAHQQAHVRSAHGGAWSGGVSSRFAAVTGCCAHCVINDHFTQSHQGETCYPRHLLLDWGADPERMNLQGRCDTEGKLDSEDIALSISVSSRQVETSGDSYTRWKLGCAF